MRYFFLFAGVVNTLVAVIAFAWGLRFKEPPTTRPVELYGAPADMTARPGDGGAH